MPTFSELIRQKEHLLMRLVPISVRQLEIVQSADVSRLIQLLGQKQQLMYEFEEIERQLAPHREIPPEERVWSDEAERTETGAAINRCAAMLEEILRNDTRSTDELSAQKNVVEEQLRRTRQGAQIHNGYAKQAPKGNIKHFDKRS